jgi:glucose/arabinose dehydrogenase
MIRTRSPALPRSRSFTVTRSALPLVVGIVLAVAPADPVRAQALTTRVVASGLSAPVDFVPDPSDDTVQYIVQQGGRIRVLKNGVLQAADFLNLTASISTGGERGLLGLAFPPDYAESGRFYVNFTNLQGHTVVARFKRSATNPLIADAALRLDLSWPSPQGRVRYIAQPYSNHNGGHMAFGPDGYLYIGMGDGGGGNDPKNNAQNRQSLLGKLLRIDVSVPDSDTVGARIPPDNPFVGTTTLQEIWSFGLRNPWKFSFDDPALGGTGALLIGDVGQSAWEEIDYEPPGRGGRNYGWRNYEGTHANIQTLPPAYTPLTNPIHEYSHTVGSSITGGFVYRGSVLGSWARGRYVFGDFITGRVWSVALTVLGSGEATASDLVEHTAGQSAPFGNISSFGVDAGGEIYIVSYSGTIRLVTALVPPPPRNLRIVR